jgi:hypothetical protein
MILTHPGEKVVPIGIALIFEHADVSAPAFLYAPNPVRRLRRQSHLTNGKREDTPAEDRGAFSP